MRLFSYLYQKMIRWSEHPHAVYYLGVISCIESSIFPIPPDIMLAPMILAKPDKARFYATVTTLTSVLGAFLGYLIGLFFFDWAIPLLAKLGYQPTYDKIKSWFSLWGGWVLFISGFTPIPFKLFTIAGGALHMPLIPFLLGSLIGRGARFYLVAGLIYYGRDKVHQWIERFVDLAGWLVIGLITVSIAVYFYMSH